MMPRILAFAGSTRRESFNKKLVAIAAQGAREAGAEVTLIDLKDFPLPLFDQDLEAEQGMPEIGKKLKKLFIDHDGLLIASPEYNSSFPAVLKNAIDWVSRPAPGEPSLVAFRGKVATLMSASPGALGGLRVVAEDRGHVHDRWLKPVSADWLTVADWSRDAAPSSTDWVYACDFSSSALRAT